MDRDRLWTILSGALAASLLALAAYVAVRQRHELAPPAAPSDVAAQRS
jgi:hypothetical protein